MSSYGITNDKVLIVHALELATNAEKASADLKRKRDDAAAKLIEAVREYNQLDNEIIQAQARCQGFEETLDWAKKAVEQAPENKKAKRQKQLDAITEKQNKFIREIASPITQNAQPTNKPSTQSTITKPTTPPLSSASTIPMENSQQRNTTFSSSTSRPITNRRYADFFDPNVELEKLLENCTPNAIDLWTYQSTKSKALTAFKARKEHPLKTLISEYEKVAMRPLTTNKTEIKKKNTKINALVRSWHAFMNDFVTPLKYPYEGDVPEAFKISITPNSK